MLALLLLCLQDLPEPQARDVFVKEYRDKSATARDVAVRRLVGLKEEKTLQLLAGALRDSDAGVRKTAAEVIATCTDATGAALRSLGSLLRDKRERRDVREACLKALAKAHYKAEPVDALIQTIGGISEQDKDLFEFGAECTRLLNEMAGQDFGAGKDTPDKWKKWWKDNQARLAKEDREKLAAVLKSSPRAR
jgi:hypothetical protein